MTSVNVLSQATIYNCTSCCHDSKLGYSVLWPENNDLGDYSVVGNLTSYTTWDGVYFGVSSDYYCYISQDSDISIDASSYQIIKVKMRLDRDRLVVVPSTGKISFQTSNEATWDDSKSVMFSIIPDNAYHEYSIDMSSHLMWGGTITRFRLYPFVDGAQGIKVHIKYIKVESKNTYACDSYLGSTVCDKAYAYSHPCPWTGSPGYSKSSLLSENITIEREVNDKIYVNIDGYGEQSITLSPVVNASVSEVCRDIQDKINLVGVGGYANARCYSDNGRIRIDSDWNSSTSSVVISEPGVFSAGKTLGFFDLYGNKLAEEISGTDSASLYERAPLQVNSTAFLALRGESSDLDKSAFVVNGSYYSPQGGNPGYSYFVRDNKIEFRNKTIIDYNNPINNNGIVKFFAYSGDLYNNTQVRIYRQNISGSYTLVYSLDISSTPEKEDMVFEKDIFAHVKKGDLIGLYSAALHIGSDYQKPNFSYVLYDGDLASGTSIQRLYGGGEGGLPLFVRSDRRSNEAVLDIDFDVAQLVESVEVKAEEEDVFEEINLCALKCGGLNGGPYISSSTGLDINGNQAPGLVNLGALIDGIKQDTNGDSPTCYPAWNDYDATVKLDYDYTDFQIVFDFAKGINVYFPIYKICSYFNSNKNIKDFKWEVPVASDPADENRTWGLGWAEYENVYTEAGRQDEDSIYLYNNPALVTAGEYTVGYEHLKYKYLQLELSPYRAKSLRFNVTFGDDPETDPSQAAYCYFPIAPSPVIEEIEVYSKSTPIRNISSCFYFETSLDGSTFFNPGDVDEVSSTEAKYLIGRPSKKVRVHISSDTSLNVLSMFAILSEDDVHVDTNAYDCVSLCPSSKTPESSIGAVVVINDSDETSNFFIDIYNEGTKRERCILWNRLYDEEYLAKSEIGPGAVIRRRESHLLRPYNYAYNCPGYFLDKNFYFGSGCYVSYNNMLSWTFMGSIITDFSDSTYISNETPLFHMYPSMYVALDLGGNYAIGVVSPSAPSGYVGFSSTVLYSKKNTSNPLEIPTDPNDPNGWNISSKGEARWVLFTAPSAKVGGPGVRAISGLSLSLDLFNTQNMGKLPWKSAGGNLTNGVSGLTSLGGEEGWILNGQSDYYCVNLMWWHSIYDIITGPLAAAAEDIDDVDVVVRGSWPSILNSSGVGANVAFSSSATDDPEDVVWGSFGGSPPILSKWIMVRAIGSRIEEIIVHTDENSSENKKSFLNSVWFSSISGNHYNEYAHTKSGICAIAIDYSEDSDEEEYLLFKQSLGIDEDLSKRDALCFWLYIEDVSQLDSSYGYFRLGKSITQTNTPLDINLDIDEYNYYEWPLSECVSILEDGWNYVCLPLSDNYKNGLIYFTSDDISRVGSHSARDRITYFKFLFRGTGNNSSFTIRIDDFSVLRRHFSTCRFTYGAYIPTNEYAKFLMNDFNPRKGTIEFFIKPDWSRSFLCNSCTDPRDHTILRVFSAETETLFGLFMTGDGFKFYVTDGNKSALLTDDNRYSVSVDIPNHIALVWNFDGEYHAPAMAIYVNNNLAAAYEYDYMKSLGIIPDFSEDSLYSLILGGRGWEGLVSAYASSVDGVVENLRVFTYPITDFDPYLDEYTLKQPKKASELIKISSDGSNYYGVEDRGTSIPLLITGVLPGNSFNVYVKSRDIDQTKIGEHNRRAYVTITRTPSSS